MFNNKAKATLTCIIFTSILLMSGCGNGASDMVKGEACRLASALINYDDNKVEMYSYSGFSQGHPVINGARGWQYMCRFDGSRVFVTGKHPTNGWRTGANRWNDNPSIYTITFEEKGGHLNVMFSDSYGDNRNLSSKF